MDFKKMKELEIDDLEHKKFPKEYTKRLHGDIHERVHDNLKKGIKI